MASPRHDPAELVPLTPAGFVVLLALARGVRHGYAIMEEVVRMTQGRTTLGPGTLYRTIQRLVLDGLILESEEGGEPDAERRRYYRLTELGRAAAMVEAERHALLVRVAVDCGLGTRTLLAQPSGTRMRAR
jgi:DNA-binding PadR family transcriptional regulator